MLNLSNTLYIIPYRVSTRMKIPMFTTHLSFTESQQLKNGGFWTVSPQRKSISLWKSVKNIQKNIKKLLNSVKSRKNQKLRKSYVDLWVKGPKFQTYLAIFTVKIQCKKMWKFSIISVGYLRKKYQWPRSQTTIFGIFA